jgi:ABC-type Mn2+/Zn2+ transport system permease subunit
MLMDWFISPFLSNQFMLNALLAGVIVSFTCAVVGTFVILRGLAFIGDAIAHGVLPGIAVAILMGIPGVVGAAVGTVVMISGVSLITLKSRLSSDTAIGLLFVGMLSLGVIIVSRSTSFSGDLIHILFGEILGVSILAIVLQVIAAVVITVVTVACARPFLLLCFDPEQAQVSGFSSQLYHYIMLALIALTVVVSFQTVGTLLVFGMLLAPAGAGALLARRIGAMMAWATVFGTLSIYFGLLASYHLNIAAGAAIVLAAVIIFFIVFTVQTVRSQQVRRMELHPPHQ